MSFLKQLKHTSKTLPLVFVLLMQKDVKAHHTPADFYIKQSFIIKVFAPFDLICQLERDRLIDVSAARLLILPSYKDRNWLKEYHYSGIKMAREVHPQCSLIPDVSP
tara:strand:+ start:236 stop:556 length:321 start_codon:yes stop_codon:yes gene_type:complete